MCICTYVNTIVCVWFVLKFYMRWQYINMFIHVTNSCCSDFPAFMPSANHTKQLADELPGVPSKNAMLSTGGDGRWKSNVLKATTREVDHVVLPSFSVLLSRMFIGIQLKGAGVL